MAGQDLSSVTGGFLVAMAYKDYMKIFITMKIPLRELGTGYGFEEKVSLESALKNKLGAMLGRINGTTWRLGIGKLEGNKTDR